MQLSIGLEFLETAGGNSTMWRKFSGEMGTDQTAACMQLKKWIKELLKITGKDRKTFKKILVLL